MVDTIHGGPEQGAPPAGAGATPDTTLSGRGESLSAQGSERTPEEPAHSSFALEALPQEPAGRYRIERELARGGQGVVYVAWDERLGRQVAFKVLSDAAAHPTAGRRFVREARITAALEHAGIAPVHDVGLRADGSLYCAQKLVRGQTLEAGLAAQTTLAGRLLLLRPFLRVCEAVAFAHARGVIHRDLKPANMLTGELGEAVVIDWGLARAGPKAAAPAADAGEPAVDSLPDEAGLAATRDGAVLGTPAWMSPEQALGAAANLDARTDVWALGAILYQLLTGRRPFPGENAAQVLTAITTAELVPVLQACPEAPQELAAVAERALRKNPQERYPSAQELAAELEAWTSGGRVAAHDYTSLQLLRKFYARNRLASWALGAALCAVVAGVVGTSVQARRARAERDSALRELAYAGGAAELLKFLVTASASKPMTSVDLLAKAEEMAVGRFNGDAETRARLQLLIGSAYGEAFDLQRSLAVLEKARASAAAAALPPLQANIDCQLGTTLSDLEKKDEAGVAFERGLALLRQQADPPPSILAVCLNARADWFASRGEAEKMLADMKEALAAAEAAQPLDRSLLSDIHTGLAEAYGRVGRAAESIAAYDLAVDDLRRAGKLDSSAGAWRVANYSQTLYRAGQVQRAAEVMREALRISSGLGDAEAAILAMNRNYLGRALTDLGKPEEARPLFEQALASARARHDEMWQGVIALTAAHAWCSPVPAEAARATALLDEAEPIVQKTLPPRHQVRPLLPLERSCVAAATGDDARAGEALRQAVRDFDAATELSAQRIRSRAQLSAWALRRGDVAEATRLADEAVALARELSKGLGGSQWLGEALAAQAAVLQRAGGPQAAAVSAEALSQLAVAWGRDAPAYRAVERTLGGR